MTGPDDDKTIHGRPPWPGDDEDRQTGGKAGRRRRDAITAPPAEPPTAPPGSGGGGAGPDAPGGGPVYRLEHRGKAGEIIVLFLINFVLTVLTLGFYRFWGKTRIRRYVWSHTRLLDYPFEYFGTGLELFLGFMFAVIVFGTPVLGVYLWTVFNPPADNPITFALAMFGLLLLIWLLFTFLYYVAMFAAFRYRVSRTRWHGIKGGMEGSAFLYGLLAFGLGILNAISLMWTKPWADTVVFQYRLSRMWLGDRKFTSTIEARGLYSRFTIFWVSTFVGAPLIGGTAAALIARAVFDQSGEMSPADIQMQLNFATYAFYGVVFLVWQLTIPWYKAALVRNIADGMEIDGIHFRTDVTGWQVWLLTVPNFLMLLFTFGLAAPYVILRTARFAARHVEIIGDIDMQLVEQVRTKPPRVGEGLLEFISPGMI